MPRRFGKRLLWAARPIRSTSEVCGSSTCSLFGMTNTAKRNSASARFTRSGPMAEKETIECSVAPVEDTVLRKLEWYRAGRDPSERQWNDLRGVWRATEGRLDDEYPRRWAGYLRVEDLLEQLRAESGA